MPLTKHTHFVGFRGDEFTRAVIIFGPPDFIHKWHDHRMYGDVGDGDVIIFANKATTTPTGTASGEHPDVLCCPRREGG